MKNARLECLTIFMAGQEGIVANTLVPDIVITDGILNDLIKLVEGLKCCGLREEGGVIIYDEGHVLRI